MKDLRQEIEKIVSNPDTGKYAMDKTEVLLSLINDHMKEVLGEDEAEYTAGFTEGNFTGLIAKSGEEIPLRMVMKQEDRNDLRAEQRKRAGLL
jgi:hypothetical protein